MFSILEIEPKIILLYFIDNICDDIKICNSVFKYTSDMLNNHIKQFS